MIHPISRLAEGRFVETAALLAFVRSDKCPEGVIEPQSDDPFTTTWFADSIMDAFFAAGGRRLSHDEIVGRVARPGEKLNETSTRSP